MLFLVLYPRLSCVCVCVCVRAFAKANPQTIAEIIESWEAILNFLLIEMKIDVNGISANGNVSYTGLGCCIVITMHEWPRIARRRDSMYTIRLNEIAILLLVCRTQERMFRLCSDLRLTAVQFPRLL